nr:hypothetical protein [Methylacidiphilum kamchatkense]
MNLLVIGTRGSPLALIQTQSIIDRLKKEYPDLEIKTKIIKTTGDQLCDYEHLEAIQQRGIFTKEIEKNYSKLKLIWLFIASKICLWKCPKGWRLRPYHQGKIQEIAG